MGYSSSSNRIIHAKDHASIQINIAEVDPATGRMTETSKMYAICGAIRRMILEYKKADSQIHIIANYYNPVSKEEPMTMESRPSDPPPRRPGGYSSNT
uniref:40S ribosomal protein S21 n=1 Tax=Timema cristinae TaxID=61476 RepID=A0A7R9D2D5_TIMCR|nr:unnamed protein product [Timema cristinae]